jgi:hypothetical protein
MHTLFDLIVKWFSTKMSIDVFLKLNWKISYIMFI